MLSKIRISPGLAIFAAFLFFSNVLANKPISTNIVLLYIYGSILIHELAHAAAGQYLGYNTKEIKLLIFGGFVKFDNEDYLKIPRHRFYISLVGPVSNLLLALLFLNFYDNRVSEFNLLIALFNLIPIAPMDGGGMVAAICDSYSFHRVTAPCIGIMSALIVISFAPIDILGVIFLTFFSLLNLVSIVYPEIQNES